MRLNRFEQTPFPRLLVAVFLLFSGNTLAIEVVDDTGRTVALSAPAERIVSLSPHGTELLFAAGAGEKIVGAVSYSDYPPAAREIPRVGSYNALDLERILALQPDLVVAWESGNKADAIQRLGALGLTVYLSEPRELEQIAAGVERLGTLAGTRPTAKAAAAELRARLRALNERYSGRPTVSVFYEIWNRPLMTVGGDHFISRLIEQCGGRNVFDSLGALAPTIDVEAVLRANPQVIVASGMGEERPEWLDEWRRWRQLDAVAHDQLHFIPPDLLQRPTPRLLDGAEQLCTTLEEARAAYGIAPR